MDTPHEKGKALELAVHAIESTILKASPSYSDKTFRIESRKVVVVGGVAHEIDIWVEVDLGKGYRAIFIFECKNWKDKVTKNEMIVFSEKIRAVQAQKGFFVAKSYTKDAEAQAANDDRLELLVVTELPAENVPVPFGFHAIGIESRHGNVRVFHRGSTGGEDEWPIDAKSATAILAGNSIDFAKYIEDWISHACDERTKTFPSQDYAEGLYDLEAKAERVFQAGELLLDGHEVARIAMDLSFKVRILRPPVVSHFDVATRGRALSLAPVSLHGAELRVTFAASPNHGSDAD
jgi:hypothetical protein